VAAGAGAFEGVGGGESTLLAGAAAGASPPFRMSRNIAMAAATMSATPRIAVWFMTERDEQRT
jgi:hypothetical protein